MPELPEVETTVCYLRKKILGRKIEDMWCDFKKIIKKPESFNKGDKVIYTLKQLTSGISFKKFLRDIKSLN